MIKIGDVGFYHKKLKVEPWPPMTSFILGSKNASINSGFYDTNLHRVWTTSCGDSVYGRSHQKFVYELSKALYMYANCSINGVY